MRAFWAETLFKLALYHLYVTSRKRNHDENKLLNQFHNSSDSMVRRVRKRAKRHQKERRQLPGSKRVLSLVECGFVRSLQSM